MPPARPHTPRPRERGVSRVPKGEPLAQARPAQPVGAAPRERGVGATPNPKKPRLVRDVHGNELKDLFELFPDLPRPARKAPRIPTRRRRGR